MGRQREALVEAALSQQDAANGREYVAWYNQVSGRRISLDSAWCAIFVSWCARQAGIDEGLLPTQAGCTSARNWFKKKGLWREGGHTPQRGDLILFDWDGDPSVSEHIGIVTKVEGGYVHTIEGNAGVPGKVRQKKYPKGSKYILGYGVWKEKEAEDLTREETSKLIDQAIKKANGEFLALLANAQKEMEAKLELATSRLGGGAVYQTIEDVPDWAKSTVRAMTVTGRLRGDGKGNLNLSHDLLRALVIMERGETAWQ